jgi:hypothetical protein
VARHQRFPEPPDLKGKAMDLIDRYLASVRLFLPRDQRDDIVAELRDLLMSQREEKEAALGRPLSRKEQEALLHDFGHPLMVAGRYRRPQSLIGPELYPVYSFVLLLVLASVGLAALITGVVAVAVTGGNGWHGLGAALGVAWAGGFNAVGAVTVIFAALERTKKGREIVIEWNVRDLPRLGAPRRQESWYEHVAGMVFLTLFCLWWVGIIRPRPPQIPLDNGRALDFAFAPALHGLYFPVLALAAGAIAVHAMKLAGRETRAIALVLDMLLQAAIAAVAAFALHVGAWAAISGVGVPAGVLAKVQHGVDIGAEVTLIVIICSAVGHFVFAGWRLLRPAPAAHSA